jgi:phosphate transport system substrate-binding protein
VVAVDGSSTVFPISEAVAEEFQKEGGARVTIGVSGTGGGFEKFCRGELAMAGASRPIKPSEVKACAEKGIEFIELPVAYDGIAVVVHKENDWVDTITVEELKKMWAPEAQGKVGKWSDVRAGWPDRELHLFGAGVDSGTYDYFTKAVTGKEHSSRGDYTSSEDDNVVVQGVSTDPLALGFFGFAYYAENQDKLKVVPVDGGKGPVTPSLQTITDGTYAPLSRPIFVYVNKAATGRDEVKRFIDFYLANAGALSKEVGYVPLPERAYDLAKKRFAAGTTGSVFGGGGSQVGVTVEQLLERE